MARVPYLEAADLSPENQDLLRRPIALARALVNSPNAARAFTGVGQFIRYGSKLDPRLRELVRIRASQINGCAYCIDMHTRDARAVGETEQRLYALPAWRETPFFTGRERAALAFTESVTLLADGHVPATAYDAVAAEFSPDEVAALVSLIVTINAWNAISVSTRAWVPGSYQP